MTRFLLLGFLLVLNVCLTGQSTDGPYSLFFRTETVKPLPNTDEWIASSRPDKDSIFSDQFFKIIQFQEIPSEATKQFLRESGITLLDYLPQNAYFASFSSGFLKESLRQDDIRSIIDIRKEYKLSPLLFEGNFPDHALAGNGQIRVLVSWYSSLDADAVIASLSRAGYPPENRYDDGQLAQLLIPLDHISDVASLPCISSMEPVYPEAVPENSTGRTLHRSNSLSSDFTAGRHFDGSGVQVMLQDDGIIDGIQQSGDTGHLLFIRRRM